MGGAAHSQHRFPARSSKVCQITPLKGHSISAQLSTDAVRRKDLSFDTASAVLSLPKGCGLWTLSRDFVHDFLLKY